MLMIFMIELEKIQELFFRDFLSVLPAAIDAPPTTHQEGFMFMIKIRKEITLWDTS